MTLSHLHDGYSNVNKAVHEICNWVYYEQHNHEREISRLRDQSLCMVDPMSAFKKLLPTLRVNGKKIFICNNRYFLVSEDFDLRTYLKEKEYAQAISFI